MKNKFIYLALSMLTISVMINSCKKEVKIVDRILPEQPFNPYDTIDYNGIVVEEITIDTHSFLGLHHFIFATKCANPACHDGTFEPDFRTIQSSYNSLVYHPVLKNSPDNFFTYRVVPGDTTKSWLWERVTTDDEVLGKMPLYDTLENWQLEAIRDWILGGAKDLFDNPKNKPGYKPGFFGIVAYLPDAGNMRIDTIRVDDIFIYPFIVPHNTNVQIWFGLFEQDIDGELQPAVGMGHNKVKLSINNPNNFTNATEMNMNKQFSPFWAPSLFGVDLPYFHNFTINTGQFSQNDIVSFRAYVTKAGESTIHELPGQDSQPYLFSYFSFIVQ